MAILRTLAVNITANAETLRTQKETPRKLGNWREVDIRGQALMAAGYTLSLADKS